MPTFVKPWDRILGLLNGVSDGMSRLDTILEINKRNLPGHSTVGINGNSEFMGTTFQDVWSVDSNIPIPTSAETLEVVFANANDTATGSGARGVTLISTDSAGNEQDAVVVASNGGTASVPGTHQFIQAFVVTDNGTVDTAGVNAGDITLQVASGGDIRARIIAGKQGSFNSLYTVPLGFIAIWFQGSAFTPKGEDIKIRSRFRFGGTGVWFASAESTTYQSHLDIPFLAPLVLPEKSNIMFQAKTEVNTNIFVTGLMQFIVIENEKFGPATTVSAGNYYV